MSEEYQEKISRRGVLRTLGVAGAASLAGCGGGGSDPKPEYEGQIEPDDGEYEEVSIPEIRSGELEPYHHVSFKAHAGYTGRGNVDFGHDNPMNELAGDDGGVDGARYQLRDSDGDPVVDAFLPDAFAQEVPDGFFNVKGFLTEEQGDGETNVYAGDPLFIINALEPTERKE